MEKREAVMVDLEQLAALMAQALEDLECPECCGPVYPFIETGARIYYEEMEWSCVVAVIAKAGRQGPKG
ncbi:MAG: hypothetical protein ACO1N5_10665 [Noviherbaspirillum sp.]